MIDYTNADIKLDEIKKEIGERLKGMRHKHVFTLDKLVQESIATKPTIIKWEKGKALPHTEQLIALAKLYECDPSYLLCESNEENKRYSAITRQTGILSKAIKHLKKLLCKKGVYLDHLEDNNSLVELAFINHLIINSSRYTDALIAKQNINKARKALKKEYAKSSQLQYIYECIKILDKNHYTPNVLPGFQAGYDYDMERIRVLIPDDADVFSGSKLTPGKINEIRTLTYKYFDILSENYEKQIDLMIYNEFMATIDNFLRNFDRNLCSYFDAISNQKSN